jgi:hypothetical protein
MFALFSGLMDGSGISIPLAIRAIKFSLSKVNICLLCLG